LGLKNQEKSLKIVDYGRDSPGESTDHRQRWIDRLPRAVIPSLWTVGAPPDPRKR